MDSSTHRSSGLLRALMLASALLVMLCSAACNEANGTEPWPDVYLPESQIDRPKGGKDASAADATVGEAGTTEAGTMDSGSPEASAQEAGPPDAEVDAGAPDGSADAAPDGAAPDAASAVDATQQG